MLHVQRFVLYTNFLVPGGMSSGRPYVAMGLRPHVDTSSSYDLALVIGDISNRLVDIQNTCTALSGLTQQVKEISTKVENLEKQLQQATSAPASEKRCDVHLPPELSVSEGAYIENKTSFFSPCIQTAIRQPIWTASCWLEVWHRSEVIYQPDL